MRYAVFARHTHPEGYGFPPTEHHRQYGNGWAATAHGYVIVIVECLTKAEEKAVIEFVKRRGVVGIFGNEWWDEWYGSDKDRINGYPRYGFDHVFSFKGSGPSGVWGSVGDNRYVGYVKAGDILGT